MADVRDLLQVSLGASYSLERELGGGGMSRVFVAEESALGRKVVVKVLPPEMAAGVSVERFKREIAIAARLQHAHIVPLLSAGDAGGLPWFTMPFVEGESLRARMTRGALTTVEAVDIVRDIAKALEYAHARDIVHRDIKPENILISGNSAVVTDFGIARAISASATAVMGDTLTAIGTMIGTPAYISPEQAVGESVDARSDLYSLGVIAYELFAGAHPFKSKTTAQAIIAAHIAESPAPLSRVRPDIPAALTAIVDRCLAKSPSDRPADASAILAALAASMPSTAHAPRRSALTYAAAAAIIALAVGAAGWFYRQSENQHWARETALPLSTRLHAEDLSLASFRVLRRAQRFLPADTQIRRAIETASDTVRVESTPAGATVSIQDYLTPDSAWQTLGLTPTDTVRIPKGYFRWKVSKPGVGEYITAPTSSHHMRFALDSALTVPTGMVRVPGRRWADMIAFVGWVGPFQLPSFLLDRFEVTNRQYQEFVDHGGYHEPRYWQHPFEEHDRILTRDEAMARFRDRTGRAGPSTWEGGHYPEGRAEYPVSGVSWFEAAAYAEYAGKSLPSFAQWYLAQPQYALNFVVRLSNIARTDVAPVGAYEGMGAYGTYDMAGNVREWTANTLDADRRFILGGAARSLSYLAADPEALSPFDRSPENGVRCVRNLEPLPESALRPIKPLERNFDTFRPASDDVYRAWQAMYAYDNSPLNARIEGVAVETPDWRKEKITFDAAYGHERVTAYLFLPKHVAPPYQTVVFFPSANVLALPNSVTLGDTELFDFIVQSGRAVIYPIYKDTYERRVTDKFPGASQEQVLRVQRYRDLGRSLDYLQSRLEIDRTKVAFLGASMGAAEGVIYTTLAQDRLRGVVFLDGGYFLDAPPAGGDQAEFAPRLRAPVLMVNGRYDFTFSLERAQNPLFRMLGTRAEDKSHVVLETAHGVQAQRPALMTTVLAWLDKYLGRVR